MIDVRPRAVVLRDETRFPVYTRAERVATEGDREVILGPGRGRRLRDH